MKQAVISGTGLYTPAQSISNEELVECFNTYVEQFNADNAAAIADGTVTALEPSSVAFIEKASGIKSRYVMEKAGILDPKRMVSHIPERADDELSLQAEICVAAASRRWTAPARPPPISTWCWWPAPTCSAATRPWRWKCRKRWASTATAST
jgi:beta-ketodecanoyl-[acyl-carrier-protein] synthase